MCPSQKRKTIDFEGRKGRKKKGQRKREKKVITLFKGHRTKLVLLRILDQ